MDGVLDFSPENRRQIILNIFKTIRSMLKCGMGAKSPDAAPAGNVLLESLCKVKLANHNISYKM